MALKFNPCDSFAVAEDFEDCTPIAFTERWKRSSFVYDYAKELWFSNNEYLDEEYLRSSFSVGECKSSGERSDLLKSTTLFDAVSKSNVDHIYDADCFDGARVLTRQGRLYSKVARAISKHPDHPFSRGVKAYGFLFGHKVSHSRMDVPAGVFSNLYKDMSFTISGMIEARFNISGENGVQLTYCQTTGKLSELKPNFENAPSLNLSVDARGSDRTLRVTTTNGEVEFMLRSTKWRFEEQHSLVTKFIKAKDDGYTESISDFLVQSKAPIIILAKCERDTSYSSIATIEHDGSARLGGKYRDFLSFLFLLERNGDLAIKSIGKLCETCLYCGRQLTDTSSMNIGAGKDCLSKYDAPSYKRNRDVEDSGPNASMRNITYQTFSRDILPSSLSLKGDKGWLYDDIYISNGTLTIKSFIWLCGDLVGGFIEAFGSENFRNSEQDPFRVDVSDLTIAFLRDFSHELKAHSNFIVWFPDFCLRQAKQNKKSYLDYVFELYGDFDFLGQDKFQRVIIHNLHDVLSHMSLKACCTAFNTLDALASVKRLTKIDWVKEYNDLQSLCEQTKKRAPKKTRYWDSMDEMWHDLSELGNKRKNIETGGTATKFAKLTASTCVARSR